ncbi:enoyl-CoA hydratase/isomerase family protein [Alphaproteobacteria bacterium]|jgi:enoyl-CoA hydratase/carnithine racemase|nr:enoyl-CoA hydratase/isomerase family protein [Alphaproteobacteria bacterium]
MAVVETDIQDQTMLIRLNRPERMNALGFELRTLMAEAWTKFEESDDLEVAIITGTGKGFCAGEDMKEALERGAPGSQSKPVADPLKEGKVTKPVIAAVNGFAMGGGFMLVERTDLRVAVPSAMFEVSEAKRWLLGGCNHAFWANLPHPVATEMSFGFRFTAERLYQMGFINRLVEPDRLLPEAFAMADHLLSLPPASRCNTLYMTRQMRPKMDPDFEKLAEALHEHGDKEDLMESRRAFKEKRKPNFNGWVNPADRFNAPTLESVTGKN